VKLKENTVTVPDYKSVDVNDMRDAFIKELKNTEDNINAFISNLAGEDRAEIDRIERAHHKIQYKAAIEICTDDEFIAFITRLHAPAANDKDPSLAEGLSSLALFSCGLCSYALRDKDLSDVFACFGFANRALGLAEGSDRTKAMNDEERRNILKLMGDKRHKENREMKEMAIQHYKNNRASFANKYDAADQIAKNIVPAKFATIRDWLKGV
jgi:hypothetical protein